MASAQAEGAVAGVGCARAVDDLPFFFLYLYATKQKSRVTFPLKLTMRH